MYSLCTYSIFKWKQTAVFLLNLDQKVIKPTQNSRSSSLTKGNGTMGTIRTFNIHPQLQVAAIACRRILTMQYHSVEGNTTKKWEVHKATNSMHASSTHTSEYNLNLVHSYYSYPQLFLVGATEDHMGIRLKSQNTNKLAREEAWWRGRIVVWLMKGKLCVLDIHKEWYNI